MSANLPRQHLDRSPHLLSISAYVTLVIGYLLGVLLANHLTLVAFLALLLCNCSIVWSLG